MLLIIEVIMLIAGVLAIATGKLPSFLFGGAKYRFEGRGVRLLGAILVLPVPIALAGGMVLALFFGEEARGYAVLLELAVVLGVLTAALIVARFIRKPATATDASDTTTGESLNVEAVIAKKAQGSLIYALLGILGFTALVVCPLAFIRAGQALRLIDEHKVGERYRGTANTARVVAVVVFLAYAAVAAVLLLTIIGGTLFQ